jgi:zinc protease
MMKPTLRAIAGLTILLVATSPAWAEGPDRRTLPNPTESTSYSAPEVQTYTLKNGITVWHVVQDQAPLISLRLILGHGAATDPAGKAGTVSMMLDLLDEGAGERDALAISDAFALMATHYTASASTDSVYFSLDMLAEHLVPSLALLSEILLTPTFPEQEFARIKAQRESSAIQREADPSTTGFVVARRVMYQDGYGASSPSGTRDTLASITLTDVRIAYASLISPKTATIVVVGSVDKDTLLSALEGSLGTWMQASVEKSAPLVEAAVNPGSAPRGIHFVDFPGASQSMVIVSRRAPGNQAEDYFSATVFNREFAGGFTGRINMNLREDKGYTYGARGRFMRSNRAGTYTIYAKVKGETTRASIDEILGELAMVRADNPMSDKEIEAGKGGLVKGFPGRFEKMSSVANQLSSLVAKGYPPDWYATWPSKISAVDPETAKKTGHKYTDPDGFHIIIAGDYSKIGDSLESLGLPLFFYDTQGNPIESGD